MPVHGGSRALRGRSPLRNICYNSQNKLDKQNNTECPTLPSPGPATQQRRSFKKNTKSKTEDRDQSATRKKSRMDNNHAHTHTHTPTHAGVRARRPTHAHPRVRAGALCSFCFRTPFAQIHGLARFQVHSWRLIETSSDPTMSAVHKRFGSLAKTVPRSEPKMGNGQ